MSLLCSVYRSEKKVGLYLYVEKDHPIDELPEMLRQQCGVLTHVMVLLLTPDKVLANAEATQVIEAIANNGFYLQMPPGEVEPPLNPRQH